MLLQFSFLKSVPVPSYSWSRRSRIIPGLGTRTGSTILFSITARFCDIKLRRKCSFLSFWSIQTTRKYYLQREATRHRQVRPHCHAKWEQRSVGCTQLHKQQIKLSFFIYPSDVIVSFFVCTLSCPLKPLPMKVNCQRTRLMWLITILYRWPLHSAIWKWKWPKITMNKCFVSCTCTWWWRSKQGLLSNIQMIWNNQALMWIETASKCSEAGWPHYVQQWEHTARAGVRVLSMQMMFECAHVYLSALFDLSKTVHAQVHMSIQCTCVQWMWSISNV